MKTIFTLLMITTFSLSAFAYDEGRLTVTVAAGSDLQVFIDGRSYNAPENTIVLNNIRSGNHSIKIYKAKNNHRGRGGNRAELLYSANIYIKPSYDVDVMVNRFGKALVDEQYTRGSRYERDNRYENNNGDNKGNYQTGYHRPLNETDYNRFLQHVKDQWFSGKLTAAREGFTRNKFSTVQVKQVLQLFSTDSDKLDLAKLVYRNITDPTSFYQLYDVFSFQSSKDELERHTRDY